MHDRLTELMDREAIRDCLYRYCRGADRADEAALRSSYWPDATDRHGAWNGPVEGFIQQALQSFRSKPRNIHQVSNILIEFVDPQHAAVESIFNALIRAPDASGVLTQAHLVGRYCDFFEKRGDDWRVLRRTVVYDWVAPEPAAADESSRFGPRQPIGGQWPDDPVYHIATPPQSTTDPNGQIPT